MSLRSRSTGLLAGASLLLLALSAQASPVAALRAVGQGEMHWLWFKLYDATLYSHDGRYHPDARPLALTLRYARAIERTDLLEATRSEWLRLHLAEPAKEQRWLTQLAALWPDVREGDELTLVVDAAGQSHFWLGNRKLGQVSDPAFAPAFLAIWLDERSRDPALGRRLKGES